MNLLEMFPGKKTYVTGLLAIAAGILEVLAPEVIPFNIGDPGELIVLGLGMVFLRKGMKNEVRKLEKDPDYSGGR